MIIVTGCYNKNRNTYRMHAPVFPYTAVTYMGYSLKEMQQLYRRDFNLKGKHIKWVIV